MKRFTALILVLALALALLAACGGNSNDTYDDDRSSDSGGRPAKPSPGGEPAGEPTPDGGDPTPAPGTSVSGGDIIEFGGHDWRVLDIQDGKALLLSDRVLAQWDYHYTDTGITWEDSYIRQRLNGEFLSSTFSMAEQARIAETTTINNDNPWYETDGGRDTTDRIFLLSIEEVVQYFGDSGEWRDGTGGLRALVDDEYNSARIAYDETGAVSSWWLRSPGLSSDRAAYIVGSGGAIDGAIDGGGIGIFHAGGYTIRGVRPAMWVEL